MWNHTFLLTLNLSFLYVFLFLEELDDGFDLLDDSLRARPIHDFLHLFDRLCKVFFQLLQVDTS